MVRLRVLAPNVHRWAAGDRWRHTRAMAGWLERKTADAAASKISRAYWSEVERLRTAIDKIVWRNVCTHDVPMLDKIDPATSDGIHQAHRLKLAARCNVAGENVEQARRR